MSLSHQDRRFLSRAVDLAEEALDAGDEPFGSVLVTAAGAVVFEDRNRVSGGDATRHPELDIARWAAEHLTPEERRTATVYTSGEHCPMCAAARGWVGLGRIIYASSAQQLGQWADELGLPPSPVAPLPVQQIVPGLRVDGPDPELSPRVRDLHVRRVG